VIESKRTTVGYALQCQGVSDEELKRRVQIKVTDVADGYGTIHTCLDNGEWVNDGRYRLIPQVPRRVIKLVNPERCEVCRQSATYQVIEGNIDHFLCDDHITEEDKSIAR